ncbi:hypothetical protein [Agitococcus lubricus]|uniref:Uncharacterized protein n=1 Tax=Agitococcus lubricus TaxID=1077255 RepID=A0A2T5IY05_9GAMM|nr:hypothetical protein [Agitococcus lubricus]PTQ88856.1 hypothetical protein C8N29_1104 [Agitococcus lubricus]
MSLMELLAAENHLDTTMGKAFLSERVVVRGQDLHRDLGHLDWFAYHIYGITGRIYTGNQLAMLSYLWASTSYPDPSIWPNNTAALAGSVRTTACLALNAGLVGCEANLFGVKPLKKVHDFLLRCQQKQQQGHVLADIIEAEIAQQGLIYGYGRPLASIDERVPHTLQKATELGLADGNYLKLALAIENYLIHSRQIRMNIAALDGAIGADLGFSNDEFHLFMNLIVYAGLAPCYMDAVKKTVGTFFPIRCRSIVNQDVSKRQWKKT